MSRGWLEDEELVEEVIEKLDGVEIKVIVWVVFRR